MLRILVTGGRDWDDADLIEHAIIHGTGQENYDYVTLVHGDAPGADTIAAGVAEKYGIITEPHPADWKNKHRAAGPIRNQEMVDCGADIALAFYMAGSKGTKDCMRRIAKAKIPLTIYPYNFDGGESVDEVDKLFGGR